MGSLSPDDLLELAREGETLVLPTPEAARDLRHRFSRYQQARGLQVWQAPRILAWRQWLVARWDELTLHGLDHRVLLNRVQEEALWSATLPAQAGNVLTGTALRALSRQARAALNRAADYGILDRLAAEADTPDSVSFAAWHRAFDARCRAEQLLPLALLPQALLDHLEAKRFSSPPSIHLVAMDAPTPLQQAIVEALRQTGITVHSAALQGPNPSAGHAGVIPGNPDQELQWAVRFLRHSLQSRAGGTPEAGESTQIALVLPDPEAERPQLESLLRQQLAPELEAVAADLSSQPWHFRTGPALASLPILDHAGLLLRWLGGELSLEEAGTLLLSPYLAHADSFESRARFEVRGLRSGALLRPEITLEYLLRLAARPQSGRQPRPLQLPQWHAVHRLFQQSHRVAAKASFADWTGHIRNLLAAAGWPGPRQLSPAEFRATEAWDAALDLLTTRDLLGERLSWSQALDLLAAELREIRLEGASPEAPVQILTLAETEGRLFDEVLVLRATDNVLPAPETLQPLLGRALQRRLGMPGSSASASFDRSLATLRSLLCRTGRLVLVSAAHDAAGELRPSTLAASLALQPLPPELLQGPGEQSAVPVPLELVPDSQPLPPPPPGLVTGGARVLELQANCGFQAFAALRLTAARPNLPRLGFDPRQAGEDLHKALEIFWSTLPGQAALAALAPAERRAAVEYAVRLALQPRAAASFAEGGWTAAYLELAHTRLTHLLLRWLDHEMAREPFRVARQEAAQVLTVGPLALSVRPDRIDEVEGGVVFVDYKTSAELHTRDWSGERPRAPQLPLYTLMAEPEQVRGVAFGRVRPGSEMGWISLADGDRLFPKATVAADGLAALVVLWRAELTRLAEAFAAGQAAPDPRSFPKSCDFCEQRLLCRLDATELLARDRPAEDLAEEDDPAG